jgi:hypothetical protein
VLPLKRGRSPFAVDLEIKGGSKFARNISYRRDRA